MTGYQCKDCPRNCGAVRGSEEKKTVGHMKKIAQQIIGSGSGKHCHGNRKYQHRGKTFMYLLQSK